MNGNLALYYRLSRADVDIEEHDISNSIKNQEILLREYVHNHPDLLKYEVMEFYDDGYSGTNFERPGIQRLFSLMKQGVIKCIIVKDFSRFGRNYIETGKYLEQIFPFFKVRFISVNDNFDSNYHNAAGALDVGFRNLMHDYYSRNMSRKISQAKRFKAENGTLIMPAFYGYKKCDDMPSKLVVDEESAKIVRLMFEKRLEGYTMRAIAKYLNSIGAETPSQKKIKSGEKRANRTEVWKADIIAPILKDVRYTGVFIYGKKHCINYKETKMSENEWLVFENRLPAIISKELFEAVNDTFYVRDTKKSGSKANLMFTKKLQCGHCGRYMFKRDYGYKCIIGESLSNSSCPSIIYRVDFLESVILEKINQLTLSHISEPIQKPPLWNVEKLQKELKKCKAEIMKIYEQYADRIISKDEYIKKRNTLEEKRKQLHSEIEMSAETGSETNKEFLTKNATDGKLQMLTPEIVDILIEKIIIYDKEKIEIIWKDVDLLNVIPTYTEKANVDKR